MKEEIIVKRVAELIGNFESYIKRSDGTFSGPSDELYRRIIAKIKNDPEYATIFDDEFILLLYATLAAWGMHRMGAEMNDFNSFKECIINNKERFIELKNLKINEITWNDELKVKLKELYKSLSPIMKSNSKLVATSKIMHFLLPHLIPPMDRMYTMTFFNRNIPTIKSYQDKEDEVQLFIDVFTIMHDITKRVDCNKFIDTDSPTITKVIDNAVIGYVKQKEL